MMSFQGVFFCFLFSQGDDDHTSQFIKRPIIQIRQTCLFPLLVLEMASSAPITYSPCEYSPPTTAFGDITPQPVLSFFQLTHPPAKARPTGFHHSVRSVYGTTPIKSPLFCCFVYICTSFRLSQSNVKSKFRDSAWNYLFGFFSCFMVCSVQFDFRHMYAFFSRLFLPHLVSPVHLAARNFSTLRTSFG